jgi:lipopolysaccharide/colanic/teichoic acid biosynthesis glycosyltransferase
VGRFLRRSSIDELPQLLNVLRGDMSLVGPRPDVPAQQALYRPDDWALRCSVRPGITGLAQATMRSEATPEQRLAADLDYVRGPASGATCASCASRWAGSPARAATDVRHLRLLAA